MYREAREIIDQIKDNLLHGKGITLTKRDLHYLIIYINELEKEAKKK